ncbi:hypothetical protein MTBSS4_90152 [Magnetospirillum sp. SS-4]|nr:hypothetical protein MTBSS4_90152 [Magnetospirillum sp. SS-4]
MRLPRPTTIQSLPSTLPTAVKSSPTFSPLTISESVVGAVRTLAAFFASQVSPISSSFGRGAIRFSRTRATVRCSVLVSWGVITAEAPVCGLLHVTFSPSFAEVTASAVLASTAWRSWQSRSEPTCWPIKPPTAAPRSAVPIFPLPLPRSMPAATPPTTAPIAAPPALQSLSKAVSTVLQPVRTTGTQIAEASKDIRPSLEVPQ